MGEETAHYIIAEQLIFIPDFSTCLGYSRSCILNNYNFSLLLEITSFFRLFFSSLAYLPSSLLNNLKVLMPTLVFCSAFSVKMICRTA